MSIHATIGPGRTGEVGTQVSGEVIILLFDGDNNPTNGNNRTVYYTQNLNGVITSNIGIVIAGQSASVYHGLLSDTNPSSLYYTKFQIDSISAEPNPSPPVNRCDLAISFINPDKPESVNGAADGQITVIASSSVGPVMYSLDNVTFQSSPTFSGLTGGLKTVYVTDPNGCTATKSTTVQVSANLLISDPSVTITGGNTSRWSAAFNPVVFTYLRKDFQVTSVTLDTLSGNAAVSVNCDTTALKNTIDTNTQAIQNAALLNVVLTNINPVNVYINAGNYIGTFQVNSATTDGTLVLNTPFSSTATGYVNINLLRPYYQVRTQISYYDAGSGQQNTITSTNRPDSTGLVKADISNFLQSLLRAKDDSDFTQINYRDSNLSACYKIAYAEYWDGKLSSGQALQYIPVTDPYYVLYAAKQLGDRYGGNLAAYVPFPSVTDSSQLAKWVTDFAEPAYSNGYPFDIGFIYSEALVGLQIYCVLTPLDINRNPLPGGPQTSYLLNEDGHWLLNQDGSKLVIANQTSLTMDIPQHIGLNRLLVNANFDSDVYYFTLALKYDDNNSVRHTVTETQTIRIDDAVDEQSIYLRWIGLSGCWNYCRFVYNQEVSLDVQNAVIIKNYVSDWENQDSIEEVIGKSAGQKIKVIAEDLSIADIKGLQSIKYSPKVQMLVNKNPVKWQTIVINTATFSEYETLNGQAPFSVTFNLPGINIQSQ